MKEEYKNFLLRYFNGIRLSKPLYYSWDISLRFDLQVGNTNDEDYFISMLTRAKTLFESTFENTDNVVVMLMEYKYRRSKIRYRNYVFKQIENLKRNEIAFTKFRKLYDNNDKTDVRNAALIKTTTNKINYCNIFTAIGNMDFYREPLLDKWGFLSSKEIYFLNLDKKIVFHMYDDRGLDIIANDIETLKPIYLKYNEWLLDYDRDKMNKIFDKKNGL